MTDLFLAVVAFVSSIVSAVVGMAGGTILLSGMTFVVPVSVIVPIHGCVQMTSNVTRTWVLRDKVRRDFFWWFCSGLPFGAYLSYRLLSLVTDHRVLYAMIAATILWALYKPKRFESAKIPTWAFSIVGFATGFLSLLVGAVGPFLGTFFYRDDMDKEEIIASQAAAQFVTHFLKIPAFLALGFAYQDHLWVIGFMAAATVLGTNFGVGLLRGMSETAFRKIFRAALMLSALRMIYKIFW